MKSRFTRVSVACVLVAAWAPAHAYIDPGTGSALIQGLIAVIAAAGITARMYWHQLKDFLGLNKNKETQPPEEDPAGE